MEGPIIGTILFFILRESLADLGTFYLIALGLVATVVMLRAPQGLWGMIATRWGIQLFPLGYHVQLPEAEKTLLR